ncbi:MAG: ATP-binding protein [Cyanobacteria bacterium P01_D01_bin.128]
MAQTKAKIAALTESEWITADLSNCDREPIHIPAAIQPHGVLIVLLQPEWTILQISQNSELYLGQPAATLLGQPLSVLLTEPQIQQIKDCLQEDFEAVNPLRFELSVTETAEETTRETTQIFSAVVHQSDGAIILELEPEEVSSSVNFFDFYSLVKRPVSRLQKTQTLAELCQVAVEEVKKITGFDRVMIYQFDEDGAGSVIAEAKQETLKPFLGLHYPATDIPKQAKYLYLLNPLRLIPDATYTPVPLVSADQSAAPLDMSLASLRSVSPLHTEYLANMGVQASMSISLICDRKLWGLIACHHNSPRKLSYEMRTICEFLGQVIGLELTSREDSEDADYQIRLKSIQTDFVTALTASTTLKQGLTDNVEQLLALTSSVGVAYCEKGDIVRFGQTPTQSEVGELVQWLGNQFDQDTVYQTVSLSQVYAPAADFENTTGLLALSISKIQQIYILWFRPEVVQTVNWAGNPTKPTETDEQGQIRISPRQSFELWKETVRQRSLPWRSCEIEAAIELRSAIIGLVLKKADELAQVNSELARSNVELDAFAYVASHDLKEPLRGIHNYSSFLIEDYGEALGEDGNSKLQTLMRLTQRMEDLINSLLHYSRIGRAELLVEPVDLNDLVNGVIELLRISKSEPVSFQIPQTLPTLQCDRTQVTELFTNLLSNAIKYNDKDKKQIAIGFLTPDDTTIEIPEGITKTILYIKDNGIGIRKRHLDAVFRIFKRLHAPGRYGGGTGAGLTIVKKIVERHGGQIWLDSVYGKGSTFYFTLEKSVND